MFDDEMDLSFQSDDELRKPIEDGTVANVAVRADKDGTLGNFKTGDGDYGPWMAIPVEVVDGDHKGEWASTMLTIKPDDRKFRAIFQVVTGMDIAGGANVSFGEFKEKLISGVFEVELGPEKKRGVETGYTRVKRFVKRVGDRDTTQASPVEEAPAIAAGAPSGGDEDIPF